MKTIVKTLTLIAVFSLQFVVAQEKNPAAIQTADFIQGELDNGMHYYIMHNEEPKDRASLWKKSIAENQENNNSWLRNTVGNLQKEEPVTTEETYIKPLEALYIEDLKKLSVQINAAQPRIV
ncbi:MULTISPECIES: hypothetical protein [unclassified Leeuwenhoekiella]|uniref:hypothetical protein n=1 Tax=unclassified Leeuwenhoekiella TaxID=2615029 RepID=UPI000C4350E5|nr:MULTISPECIES: hypothetical protein [unclassified Leeuwenhoekiella]MAW95415.1 hypothetical protein [Leeuwenhoekiella sp.]MBA80802.1 hypothetical protein [Leeuwenhoekiella sp.]|tara:strand:+ start:6282 stop:6647 length:366 start_codon:yes stop_codon:yes gene_type:complete